MSPSSQATPDLAEWVPRSVHTGDIASGQAGVRGLWVQLVAGDSVGDLLDLAVALIGQRLEDGQQDVGGVYLEACSRTQPPR